MKTSTRAAVVLLVLGAAGPASAQEPPPPTPTPAVAAPDAGVTPEEEAKKESIPFRPIEANVIIDLPSVEVPPAGTLTFLVTHRFQTPIQDASINNFFTLDNGNDWGFGLWYAPLKKLNLGFYRTSDFNIYEASAQYEFPNLARIPIVPAGRRGLAHGDRALRRGQPEIELLHPGDPGVLLRAVRAHHRRPDVPPADQLRPGQPERPAARRPLVPGQPARFAASVQLLGALREPLQRPGRGSRSPSPTRSRSTAR